MFEAIGFVSGKVYFKGSNADCIRFINENTHEKPKRDHKRVASVGFGFEEAIRIQKVVENVKS